MTTTAPDVHTARAMVVLAYRLAQRRGLTMHEAFTAIDQCRQKEPGPHTHLVSMEAAQLLTEATAPVRAMLEALRPLAESATRAMAELARALAPITRQAATSNRGDRPAWVSPYGPPPRRRN